VAKSIQGPVVGKESPITFGEQTSVVLKAGEEKISDAVSMSIDASSTLAISFEIVKGDALTGHLFASQTSYISSAEPAISLPPELASMQYPLTTNSWWLITGLDVMPSTPLSAVVAFGSSTTDGTGSTPNTNGRWPDYLARRLKEVGGKQYMAVVNAGLAGNQLTSSENKQLDEHTGTSLPKCMMGDAGLRRCNWDLISRPGATDLILHIGSNDLRAGVDAQGIIDGYKEIVQVARKSYKKVFGTTILPGGYTPEQSKQLQSLNEWMLKGGSGLFDAVFDMGSPLRAETDQTKLNPEYDCGDGIHPNNDGYRLMADAIDISQLSGS
jgi:lysophospholipase L1-like esterase